MAKIYNIDVGDSDGQVVKQMCADMGITLTEWCLFEGTPLGVYEFSATDEQYAFMLLKLDMDLYKPIVLKENTKFRNTKVYYNEFL